MGDEGLMARIRTVKPEFWSSPDIDDMDPWARLLYVAMWNWADDHGRGTAELRELMGFAFPREHWMTLDVFRRLLGEIHRGFGVKFYKVRGRSYYLIPSWENHQKIDKRAHPKHPAPEEGTEYDPCPPGQRKQSSKSNSPEDSGDPIEDTAGPSESSALELGTGEQGNRGKKITSEIRDDVEALCSRLHERITANGAKATIGKQWRTSARLILDRDDRELDQALRLIDWATNNSFWGANILSMPKFREKYDQLLLQARAEHNKQREAPRHTTDENIARLMGTPLRALPGGQT